MTGDERLALTSGGADTVQFLRRILALSENSDRRVLIDLSAAPDRDTFDQRRYKLYNLFKPAGTSPYWLQTDFDKEPSPKAMRSKLAEANILYVDGGNARRFAEAWRWWFRGTVAQRVREGSLVGAGSGAGALLWFARGHNDARRYEVADGKNWNYTFIHGLGVIPAWATIHWDKPDERGRLRRDLFGATLSSHRKDWHTAIGLDSAAALVCTDGVFEVMQASDKQRSAVHVYQDSPKNPIPRYPGEQFIL